MKGRSRGTWLVALGLGVALALGLISPAWAQYPPAAGSVVLSSEDTTPDLGEEIAITAAVQDQNGDPLIGLECTFSIISQPGDDASVDPGPFATDAAGNVATTLNTGSAAGTIVVEAACAELSAVVSVVAGAGTAPSATEPSAAPPASLPDTGISSESGDTGWAFWALIAVGTLIGLAGLAMAWRRVKA